MLLPVNSAGILLDPVLTRSKTLYPDNYQRYYRACRDGSLQVGSCLLHKREHERAGLSAHSNSNQPIYIANVVISDHPYHPTHQRWLVAALDDLAQQLMPLIRYQGIRKMSVLTRPLISNNRSDKDRFDYANTDLINNALSLPLDWHSTTLPLLIKHLQDLPKLRIKLHVPKDIDIQS